MRVGWGWVGGHLRKGFVPTAQRSMVAAVFHKKQITGHVFVNLNSINMTLPLGENSIKVNETPHFILKSRFKK